MGIRSVILMQNDYLCGYYCLEMAETVIFQAIFNEKGGVSWKIARFSEPVITLCKM